MMPDLGPYLAEVLGAYAATLGLLGGLVTLVWRRAVRVRRQLRDIEHERKP